MGMFDWLWNLFRAKPLTRRVARLAGADAGLDDEVLEVVDTGGGPLKEHQRRLALRDRRLLPKRKPVLPTIIRKKRKPIMPKTEAQRLFSYSLRTRNRGVRDLLPDEEQLARYGLPVWRTDADLAAALGISVGKLHSLACHRLTERTPNYISFVRAKRDGGRRIIMAPKKQLKAIQRTLHKLLVERLPTSEHAHGFRAGRSIKSNAEAHVGKKVVLKLDLVDFFPTVTYPRIRGLLLALGYGYPVAASLALLMTECERQPVDLDDRIVYVPVSSRYCVQGAPTSPGLCNAVLARLDRRLAGLAKRFEFSYTRYADDLAFSGDDGSIVQRLRVAATRIVAAEGFAINPAKTRVLRSGGRQVVTGVVVNDRAGLSRQERRRWRARIHRLSQNPQTVTSADRLRLRGQLAYLAMLNADQAAPLARQAQSIMG